jgi:hypothetical protein
MQLASKEAEVLHGIGADLKAIMEYGNSSGHASQRWPPAPLPHHAHTTTHAHTQRARAWSSACVERFYSDSVSAQHARLLVPGFSYGLGDSIDGTRVLV